MPPKVGFPIEIETQISKLITYSLAIFYIIKIDKLYIMRLLILVSISIGNPPKIESEFTRYKLKKRKERYKIVKK